MDLKFNSPVIFTNNLDSLKKFYSEKLKLAIELDFGPSITLECGISIWQLAENHRIVEHLGYKYNESGNKNMELYFETEDFAKTLSVIQELNLPLLHDEHEETWGQKTIRFYDPDNNLIEIGETIPGFIRRMHSEGLSAEQIASKSSVNLHLVNEYLK